MPRQQNRWQRLALAREESDSAKLFRARRAFVFMILI